MFLSLFSSRKVLVLGNVSPTVTLVISQNVQTSHEAPLPLVPDNVTCPASTAPCASGSKRCVLQRSLCDGQKDCTDGSDEEECMYLEEDSNMSKCNNKSCWCSLGGILEVETLWITTSFSWVRVRYWFLLVILAVNGTRICMETSHSVKYFNVASGVLPS